MPYQITTRQKKLLQLLSREKVVTGDLLAKSLSVTSRTVRTEISDINTIFHCTLICSTPSGYSIDPKLFYLTKQAKPEQDKATIRIQLTWELFSGRCSNKAADIADKYFISTALVYHLLKEISENLANYQLQLVKRGPFYQIEGSEFARRVFLNTMLLADAHSELFELQRFDLLFEQIDVIALRSSLLEILFDNELQPEQVNLDSLTLNVAIAFDRLIKKQPITSQMEQLPYLPESAEFRSAQGIASLFTKIYGLSVSENDVQYFYLLVFGQTRHRYKDLLTLDFVKTVDKILSQTFQRFNLVCPYESILENLAYHIYFLVIRSKIGNATYNSLLDNLRTQTPFMYDVAVNLASLIQQEFSVPVADSEIGYLALVLGGMLDQVPDSKNLLNCVIVCGNHPAIGIKIQEALTQHFSSDLNFLGTVPRLPHNAADNSQMLFLSCVPEAVPYKNVVTVGAIISNRDIQRIRDYIADKRKELNRKKFKALTKDYFCKELFFHNLKFDDKYEAIRFLSQKVIEFGIADNQFMQEVLQRERTSSTCFLDSFAIPHPLTFPAERSAICILSTDSFIPWDEHEIKFVCLLVLSKKDRERFYPLYQHLVELLCDIHSLSALAEAADFDSFVQEINLLM